MNKSNNKLALAFGWLIAACALMALFTQTTQAQAITIGNSQSNPVQMRDVDVAARTPFVVEAVASPKDGLSTFDGEVTDYGTGANTGSLEIPKGYRFVIEYIWATANLLPGEMLNVDLSLPLEGMQDKKAMYSFALKDGVATGYMSRGPVVLHASYEKNVRIGVGVGDITARFTFQQALQPSPQLSRSVRVYLSGYLEKLPSTHPRVVPTLGTP